MISEAAVQRFDGKTIASELMSTKRKGSTAFDVAINYTLHKTKYCLGYKELEVVLPALRTLERAFEAKPHVTCNEQDESFRSDVNQRLLTRVSFFIYDLATNVCSNFLHRDKR